MIDGVIMAHKKRREWAWELEEETGFPIVWDRINDRHETGLRCLQAGLDSEATHWVVVQDDALVCRDFAAGVAAATSVSGDRLVGLYIGNFRTETTDLQRKVLSARAARSAWLAMPGPWWGVGIVVPTVHLPALTEWYAASDVQNYDRRIERWARQAGVECWYTNPSLVQHRHGDTNPSLVSPDRSSTRRRAQWFIGEDVSALDIDWTRRPDDVALTTSTWRHVDTGRVLTVQPGSMQAIRMYGTGQWEPVPG